MEAAAFGCAASSVVLVAAARQRAFWRRREAAKLRGAGAGAGEDGAAREARQGGHDGETEAGVSVESTSVGSVRNAEAQLELEREERVRVSRELEAAQARLEETERALVERDEARAALARECRLRKIIEDEARAAANDSTRTAENESARADLEARLEAATQESARLQAELDAAQERLEILEDAYHEKILACEQLEQSSGARVRVSFGAGPVAAPVATEPLLEAALAREEAALDRVIALEQALEEARATTAAHDAEAAACVEALQDKLYQHRTAESSLREEVEALRAKLNANGPTLNQDASIEELRTRYLVVSQLELALREAQEAALKDREQHASVVGDLERALEHNRELTARLEEAVGSTAAKAAAEEGGSSMLDPVQGAQAVACLMAGVMLW
ncbi:Hypothetical Protein FCC1311_041872 [Hondaea fermentalgiana]|uniref:Uncharacterized protein n=1 Tax=Hondaea fermentalgiana TaxID=2315210 RepID=A0A2R5GJD0_9STRA|nr:Hypothetical Protein FCC1311_041872 [Hondaea fermentalgiana]|eukprot:GBG27964.1 Hypothetical Protein FCC1311_041872 [Hondaea fermentalgiana]